MPAVPLCFHLDLAAFLPPGGAWTTPRRYDAKRLVELTQRLFASCSLAWMQQLLGGHIPKMQV